MKRNIFISVVLVFLSFQIIAQEKSKGQKASLVISSEPVVMVPSIAEQMATGQFIPAKEINKEFNPKKTGTNTAVPGKGLPKGVDPLWQKQANMQMKKGKDPILTFEAATSSATPSDPTGAVGPNHFINAWNSSFRIWDKAGNPLTAPAALGTILYGNEGDPIVFYDQFADRFVVTEFYSNGFGVAVCQGSDPVNDGWYLYQFNTNVFPDYPKFSLWSDGYYITSNKDSGSAGSSEVVFAVNREKMIAGDNTAEMVGFPLTGIATNGFYSPLGFNVNGDTPPPPGNAPIVYMQDDAWSGVSTDHLKIWSVSVDWDTPSNSTISAPQIINTTPFDGLFDGGSFSNLPQPSGPDIDALQATIMYMAQYRHFPDHNSAIFNFVVDLDGNDNLAGIRWYELRQNNAGDPWTIYQEGTYTQPDGHSAFAGAMAMDIFGNIGMSYTVVSGSQYPSLRFTGRLASDPLGTMTLAEESFAEGTMSDPATRYGDYSQMTVDPSDGKTFWAIGEYFNGGRKNQVGVFKIASDLDNDVGIMSIVSPVSGSLGANESITVTIHNYGLVAQSGIPVNFQIDDGAVISENYSGTINPGENYEYTFSATGDFSTVGQTYTLKAFTSLSNDEFNGNDSTSVEITNLFADDIGVTAITSPVSGGNLTNSEAISITITNFGAAAQSGFDVSYVLDGGSPVTETVSDAVAANGTLSYTFGQTGDFSALGDHSLIVYTMLSGDTNNGNDTTSVIVTKTMCQPNSDCSYGDGIQQLQLAEIDNYSGCDPEGYGDYTDLIAELHQNSSNDLTLTTGYGNQHVRLWIDMNDDFVFSNDEALIEDFVLGDGSGGGTFTETTQLEIAADAPLGEHLMRIKTNWNNPVPEDACEESSYGETEDYTAKILLPTGINNPSGQEEFYVNKTDNNHFSVHLSNPQMSDAMFITVHDLLGRNLIFNKVESHNGEYHFEFDMSYAESGVYLLRIGNRKYGKVRKIVVE